jgi:ATP-dependent Clp protease ATP-binding subunit ClpC
VNYNFTDGVRKALAMAREETIRLGHDYVGTEHILLGLIREEQGAAAAVLANFAIDLEQVKDLVAKSVRSGAATIVLGELPYNTAAKKVLEFAMAEARDFKHTYVGTEHLLLGLLREERGVGGDVLTRMGMTLDATRQEVARLLDYPEHGTSRPAKSTQHSPYRTRELLADQERRELVSGLLRPAAMIALRLGVSPRELRAALERAIDDVFDDPSGAD